MNTFRFADPWWLGLVLVVLGALWWRSRPAARPTVAYSSLALLRDLPVTLAQRIKRFLPILQVGGLLLLVIALARPQAGTEDVRVSTTGVAMQLVFDRSGSMRELDLDEDRFDRVNDRRIDVLKRVLEDFLDEGGDLPGRPNDLVGLVSFAGYPKAHGPLTLDHGALVAILEGIDLPVAIDEGDRRQRDRTIRELNATALGDGLVLAVDRLRDARSKSKVVVLLSDGASNTGVVQPEQAADQAAADEVRVYTIGIGTRRRGLDEETLQSVAERTGGRYWNVRTAADLTAAYEQIDELERTELETLAATRWRELHWWFALGGLVLIALHRVLVQTRFRSLPS